jgi:hypothetical protein
MPLALADMMVVDQTIWLYQYLARKPKIGKDHRYLTSRFKMCISADVHPWGDVSLLTAPPPTTSGVKSY